MTGKSPDKTPVSVPNSQGIGPIVSSSHLASGEMPSLSEMEYAMIVAGNAFSRWTVHCMNAAGQEGLTPLEIQVLHSANHRDREKTLGDLCLVLNIEDTHLVTYAIKKLVKLGLVQTGKRGKEKTVAITKAGQESCERYKEVREALLVSTIKSLGIEELDIHQIAALLRAVNMIKPQEVLQAFEFK